MFKVPADWKIATILDTVDFNGDFTDGDWIEAPFITTSGIRLIQTGNIGRGEFLDKSENKKFISKQTFRELGCKWVRQGDVLICRLADPIGRACEVPRDLDQSIASVDVTILRINTERFEKRYVVHWLNSEPNLKHAADRAGGSTRSRISRSNLGRLPIPHPPFNQQKKIAQILDALDTQIRQTEALIAKLELIKQGLLTDLLTRGIDQNGQLRPPPEQAPELYKDSPLGRIPREWGALQIKDLAEVKGGKRLPAGHDYVTEKTLYKYLRVIDFFEREYSLDSLNNLSKMTFSTLSRYEIQPDDLFISIAGSIGYVGVHRPKDISSGRTILTENAARIVLTERDLPDFLALTMNSFTVQSQIEAEKGTGGGVPKLALFRIEQLWLMRPDPDEQYEIVKRSHSVSERIWCEREKLKKMKLQKNGLMDDLLTGRVRVTPLLEEKTQAVG